MGIRHTGRVIALQSLYQVEITGKTKEEILDFIDEYSFVFNENENELGDENYLLKAKGFAKELVSLVLDNLKEIDSIIPIYLKNWKYERILTIDRNILRLGVAELLYRPDIPYKVTINEAIELAKEFGDEKSGSFVNGVLDNFVKSESEKYEILKVKILSAKSTTP